MTDSLYDSKAQPYPFDLDALDKGSRIPVEQIEDILGIPRDHINYPLKAMPLKEQLERDLAAIGKNITIKQERGDFVLLTDAEASEYGHAKVVLHFRRARHQYARAQRNVDPEQLTPTQRMIHNHYTVSDGAILAAARREIKRQAQLTSAIRKQLNHETLAAIDSAASGEG